MRIIQQILTLLIIVYVCIGHGYAQTNNNCGPENFLCNNGECLEGGLLCDGKADCKDSSDETEARCKNPDIQCPSYAFRCNYGACISGDLVCNGFQDCVDNSDETQPQCRTTGENQTRKPAVCRSGQFTCNNGNCINSTSLCDGIRNCADGSDEASECALLPCSAGAFRCAYGACIDGDLKCNGVDDCADGSDENSSSCGGVVWPSSLPPTRTTHSSPITTIQPPTSPTSSSGRQSCRAPLQPQNGRWKLHESQCPNGQCTIPEGTELGLGSHLVYSCNEGHNLNGSADVICSFDGKWLNIPVCTEIRCRGLTTASVDAACTTYAEDRWVPCESPVLPGTKATLTCKTSYRRETSLLSRQRSNVKCNTNGQWEPEPITCVPVCGIQPVGLRPTAVHGYQPNITEFPWHASLYRDIPGKSKEYFCGASIIQENLLITAAHCIYDDNARRVRDPSKIYVVTGNIFRDYDNFFHDDRIVKKNRVKSIYYERSYIGLTGNYGSDIAILELVEPFVLTSFLVPVCIDTLNRNLLEEGTYGKVAGFGRTEAGETSAVLQALIVPYVPLSKCKAESKIADTERYITIDKFCAGYTNGSAVCDGDSGGGLVFQTNNLWYLRGIVSVSLGTIQQGGSSYCDPNTYSLYTQVSSHISWIQDVIVKIEQNRTHLLYSDKTQPL
ncbi:hypothetical protein P5V15_005494 [Pogonomyrmex californicus]